MSATDIRELGAVIEEKSRTLGRVRTAVGEVLVGQTLLVDRMLIGLLCFGSVLVKWGSSDYDATPYGMIMMILAVVSGAFKYVLAHSMIRTFRDELGVLAFTFWVEVLVAIMLTRFRVRWR